jgi:transcriptional regulator with XRE-family HTH domain
VRLSDQIAAVPGLVRAEMQCRGLTYRDVATESGIKLMTVWNVVNGTVDPKLSTLVRLARWLEGG